MMLPKKLGTMFLVFMVLISGLMCMQNTDKKEKINARVMSNTVMNVKRVGMVIGIKPGMIDEYKRLHADSNPGVRDLLTKYHMHNFSIFLHQIDKKWYEFGYYEYTGNDFEGDMEKLGLEPRNKEWLKVCDPMQLSLPGSSGWTEMERIYYNR